MAVVGKKLEHEIEQLHCFCDIHLRHGFDRSRSRNNSAYHQRPQSASPIAHGGAIGSISDGSLFLTLPTRVLTGHAIIPSEG
jgi:hypothetical protein